ncbi:MAG: phage portal protein, partial [Leisingera sp.]
ARSEIGVAVTIPRARQVPVVRGCLSVLAESIAGLEIGAFRTRANGQRERLLDHPVIKLLRNPNSRIDRFTFIHSIVDDLSSHGDFIAAKIWNDDGELVSLRRIDPASGEMEETREGTKRFRYTDKFGETHTLLEEEMWHIPRPPVLDEIKGTSPILVDGKEAIAVAIALQKYANILFTNDATPPYVWAMPEGQSFKDVGSKKNFLASIRRWTTGKNRHRPAVLEYGIKPERLGLTSEEAQFLETRREPWLDLLRLWRVPPHKLGILERSTHNNIEHQSLEFVTDCLRPILELIESSIAKFLLEEEEVVFEFNVRSLLRGDLKARYDAYAMGRQWGWLSVNDVLRMENENGIGPAGDRYIEPLNMVPVGAGMDRREKQEGVEKSIAYLHESVRRHRGRPRLEIVKDAA